MVADAAEAARWYRLAAAAGFAPAQDQLGWLYAHGFGVAPDDAAAADWFRRAAVQGYAPAQENLAELFLAGRGVPQSDEDAKMVPRRRLRRPGTGTRLAGKAGRAGRRELSQSPLPLRGGGWGRGRTFRGSDRSTPPPGLLPQGEEEKNYPTSRGRRGSPCSHSSAARSQRAALAAAS